MNPNMTAAGQARTTEPVHFRTDPRRNAARRIRRTLPWGARGKWDATLKALEESALLRNVVLMMAECESDDGRYALAEELIDAVDIRLRHAGKAVTFGDRVRSLNREVSDITAAMTEVLLMPNDPNAKARLKEEAVQLERVADQLGDEL